MTPDIIAYDRSDRAVLIVSVKAWAMPPEDVARAIDRIEVPEESPPIRFLMLVDYRSIRLAHSPEVGPRAVVLDLPASSVFGHYDAEVSALIESRGLYHPYLVGLIEAWLRDLAYRWKSPEPPGLAEIERLGLLPLLIGGTTRSGVELEPDPVH
ncbi:MAG: hypothetical protein U0800_00920 [Isosphaeraceae bacterium]